MYLLVCYLNHKMHSATIKIGWSLCWKQNVLCYVLNLVGNFGFQMVNVRNIFEIFISVIDKFRSLLVNGGFSSWTLCVRLF